MLYNILDLGPTYVIHLKDNIVKSNIFFNYDNLCSGPIEIKSQYYNKNLKKILRF